MQAQLQALAKIRVGGTGAAVARPQVFDKTPAEVSGFVTVCRLYIRMKIREMIVEEQIQWILSYVYKRSADVWKKNILEDLEAGLLEYKTVGEFLADIRKEFGEGDEKSVKVAELKKLKQGKRIMEEFIQEFKRVARGNKYKGKLLVEEFKKGINTTIH